MGISSDPPSTESKIDSKSDPKSELVTGYPQPPPPPYPPPYPHGACAPLPYQYPHGYPSSSSYPPGYPSSSSSFQPYPGYPQPYNDYYYQQQYYRVQESRNSAVFGRVVLMLMIVFIMSMCVMSMMVWLLFGTYIPEFEVKSVKVYNFTATNTALRGIWSVEMFVFNYNKDLDIYFEHGVSSIFYKDAMLGISPMNPFKAEKHQQSNMSFHMPAAEAAVDQSLLGWVLPALAQDRSNGAVVFDLRLAADANFSAPDAVYRQERLKVLCRGVQISFSPATGEGTLSPDSPRACLVRLHDSLV